MATAGDVVKQFYDAAIARDLAKARTCLHDDSVFVGLFETYRNADDYIAASTGLLQVTVRLDVKTIIAEGDEAAVFFELENKSARRGRRLGRGVAQDQERQDCACRIGL
jgi:ketosteroid isomerase-like protein